MRIGAVFHWELGRKYVINLEKSFLPSPLEKAGVFKFLLREEANHVNGSRERPMFSNLVLRGHRASLTKEFHVKLGTEVFTLLLTYTFFHSAHAALASSRCKLRNKLHYTHEKKRDILLMYREKSGRTGKN